MPSERLLFCRLEAVRRRLESSSSRARAKEVSRVLAGKTLKGRVVVDELARWAEEEDREEEEEE